jgi:hypothetical protein
VSGARKADRASERPVTGAAMKETAGHDISVGSPDLAGQAMAAASVDEMHLFLTPVTDRDGTPTSTDHLRSNLDLLGWTAWSAESFTCGAAPAADAPTSPQPGGLPHGHTPRRRTVFNVTSLTIVSWRGAENAHPVCPSNRAMLNGRPCVVYSKPLCPGGSCRRKPVSPRCH